MAAGLEVSTSIPEIASQCGVREDLLAREITNREFYNISGYLSQWKLLAPLLNITPAEVEAIEGYNLKAKMQFLEKWKGKVGHWATYRALMEALLGIGRADDARGVCQVLKAKSTTVPLYQHTDQILEELRDDTEEVPTPPPASTPSPPAATAPPAPPPAEKEFFCKEHSEKRVELYCEECDELICNGCVVWGGHHDHKYRDLREAAEQHRQEMTASLEPVEKCLTQNKEALAKVEGRDTEISHQQTDVEVELQKTFDQSMTEIVVKLNKSTVRKKERLAGLREQLEATLRDLSSCLESMRSLETDTPEEVLANKTSLAKQVKRLTSLPPPDQLEPMSEVTLSDHRVDQPTYFEKTVQIAGLPEPPEEGGASEQKQLQKDRWVMFEIVTSPETAAIYRTSMPWDAAIDERGGQAMVIKLGEEDISVLIPQGKRLQSFGKPGSGRGEFQFPSAVEVDGVGKILVADCYNHRIQHFTSRGKFIRAAGSRDGGPLQLKFPSGIAFNRWNDKIYVTDSQNVLALNSDLTLASSFRKRGSGDGYVPCGIACNSIGNVYVPDYEGHCIQVFTAGGELVKTIRRGEKQGRLNSPSHVAVDSQDNVYVSEKNHRVSVFTSTHVFLTSYSSPENRPKEFLPRGVAVDSNGAVYVCDWVNSRVQILR